MGRTYPPTEVYEVGREKIREFADAIGDPNPAYPDPAAAKELGHPDVIAPPTFPIVITFPAAWSIIEDPELGLDFSRVVHGDQRFVYTRPVRAGDRLTVTAIIEAIKPLGQRFLDTRSEVTRGRRARGDRVVQAGVPSGRGGREDRVIKFADVAKGDELPAAAFPIRRLDLVKYAGASGDFNPIHWNERFAQSVGLPDVIAHGMFTMAEAVRVVTDWAATRARWSSTGCGSPSRSWCRTV